ncbi:MAG: SEC-C domain-containing protein, partial [Parasporobacterium sp.]|nr:SEC-C domain-containing protein [Parasporobacterium sp.]
EYDQVMNEQRELIYAERGRVLNGESMRKSVLEMVEADVKRYVEAAIEEGSAPAEWDLRSFNEMFLPVFSTAGPVEIAGTEEARITEERIKAETAKKQAELVKQAALNPGTPVPVLAPRLPHLINVDGSYNKAAFMEEMASYAQELYENKEKEFPVEEHLREVERVVLLRVIDRHWMNHIDDMEQLRQGIGLAAYGQKDPLVEYKMQGFDMFDDMIAAIQEDTVRTMFRIRLEQKVEREQVAQPMATNKDESLAKAPKKRDADKVYPNDPCPCGSGKKYKQCCGRK